MIRRQFSDTLAANQTIPEHPNGGDQTLSYNEVGEKFSLWLPFLSEGLCDRCKGLLQSRVQNLASGKFEGTPVSNGKAENSTDSEGDSSPKNNSVSFSSGSSANSSASIEAEFSARGGDAHSHSSRSQRSFRHLTFADDLSELNRDYSINHDCESANFDVKNEIGLSKEDREEIRFKLVGRKKNFEHVERVNGKTINVVKGLELHTQVFSTVEQKKIVDYIYRVQEMGRKGQLKERTYSEPRKWMRGKGRVTIQFGCCYNYAVDKVGNPPGIIRYEEVDPISPLLKTMIKRLVRWHVLPPTCVPNSCIVNIYDEGDCIPPHIDHHDFVRPFCTVSFLTESNIVFGSNLKIVGRGEFSGPIKIPLPVGSVLVLNGNGADVAKHCVPAVPGKRISITFRKMDDSKLPFRFKRDPELEKIQPLVCASKMSPGQPRTPHIQHSSPSQQGHTQQLKRPTNDVLKDKRDMHSSPSSFHMEDYEFPPLGGMTLGNNRQRPK